MNKTQDIHKIYAADGKPTEWSKVVEAVRDSDVIVVGEIHNNAYGHKLEMQLAEAMLKQSNSAAVAMEMFERHNQDFVDLYLDGQISAETLVKITGSTNWGGGTNSWDDWYQPIVDAVKNYRKSGAGIIAANAPRPYVKLARMEGFEVLQKLKEGGNSFFELPDIQVNDSRYEEKFMNLMMPDKEKTGHKKMPRNMPTMDCTAIFRSQQVWDATMAMSVVNASKNRKVMLLIGDFHIADNGGTLLRIRRQVPDKKIVSISILPSPTPELFREKDYNHADFIIYTGTK